MRTNPGWQLIAGLAAGSLLLFCGVNVGVVRAMEVARYPFWTQVGVTVLVDLAFVVAFWAWFRRW